MSMNNFDVNFDKKDLNVSLNIGGEELKTEIVFPAGDVDLTPVAKEQTLLDKAEEIKQAVEDGGGSGILEEFWDVVPEDSEEIISEEDIHAAVEDIWTQTFNS